MSEALVVEHLPLARRIAAAMARRMPMARDDIESAAMLGLVQAAQAFNPKAGFRFEAFASARIRGAILDEAREEDHLSRDHRQAVKAGKVEAPRRESIDDEVVARRISGEVAGGTVAEWMSARDLHALLRHLPRRLQTVVRRHFIDDVSLTQIGAELGVTESRACQILREAKERLVVRLLPYEAEVDEAHRQRWRKAGSRRQTVCLRGHELTGYNVVSRTRTKPRKKGGKCISTIRLCRRCLLERARRFRWSRGTQPFGSFHQPRHKLAKLTDDQVRAVLEALGQGVRVTYIARRYGVATLVIRSIRDGKTYRDVPRPPGFNGARRPPHLHAKLAAAQVDAIVRRLASGERACAIAVEYAVSASTICDIRHGRYHHRVKRPHDLARDARRRPSHRAKLTAEQVREARAALSSGAMVASVARRLGVAWNTVKALRDGRTYRHVGQP